MSSFVPAQIASFEAAAALEWSVDTGPATLTRSTAQAHAGAASMLIDAIGGSYVQVVSDAFALDDTVTTAGGWVRPDAPARTVTALLALVFYDGAMGYLGMIVVSGVAAPDATWTEVVATGTAPAGAVLGQLSLRLDNTAAAWSAGEGIYADDFYTAGAAVATVGWVVG